MIYASLPLGKGVILDPFTGSGSTVAAACAHSISCICLEHDPEYYELDLKTILLLAELPDAGRDNGQG